MNWLPQFFSLQQYCEILAKGKLKKKTSSDTLGSVCNKTFSSLKKVVIKNMA